ncbi:MAG: S41 family peptidase [Planctomycetes bacterium]|nr:S41 family peptidase [Planctomycetota bacterium]
MSSERIPPSAPGPRVPLWFLLTTVLSVALAGIAGVLCGRRLAPGANLPAEELRILSLAYDHIDEHYIFELPEERRSELMHSAIAGMVEHLDHYSRYYPPQKEELYNRNTNGIMTGIGVVVQTSGDHVLLVYPYPDGPAARAGLEVGDIITAIGDKAVQTMEQAVELIRGEPDSPVRLTVRRGGAAPRVFELNRGAVRLPSVKWARLLDREAGIGYVYLEKFTRNSDTELTAELAYLEKELGRRLSGLVVDLRHNPGGLLPTCLALTNRFIPSGTLVTLKRREHKDEEHRANPARCTRPDLALAVLIDGESASASEVFAGALQDHGRARLVGTRSFGKGVVQTVFRWSKHKIRLKFTTSYYVTPNGRTIEKELRPAGSQVEGGLAPDRAVPFADRAAQRAVLLRLHRREVPREYRAAVTALADQVSGVSVSQPLGPDRDAQLAAGLEEVRSALARRPAKAPNAGTPRAPATK